MLLITLSCLGSAQTVVTGVADADVQTAFTNLRQDDSLFLRVQGTVTELKGGSEPVIRQITSDDFWSRSQDASGNPNIKNELLEYLDGNEISRSVGDGVTLWHYNLLRAEYRTGLYGRYDSLPSPTYQTDLLNLLQIYSTGYSAFTVKLLDESFGGTAATFKNWIPGTVGEETVADSADNSTTLDVKYARGTPVNRSVTFHLLNQNGSLQLQSIDYYDATVSRSGSRIVAWTLTPYPVLPSSANFVPYSADEIKGWIPVTGSH